ncbi:MAG: hypothetical protein ABSA76_10490 [Bacteroidales bacterium]
MKKYLSAFLLSFCSIVYLNAQEGSASLVGEINSDFYIWESRPHKSSKINTSYDHFLLRFDPSMKLIIKAKLGISKLGVLYFDEQVEQVILIGNKIVLITLTNEKNEENQVLYYQFIDPVTLAKQGEKSVLIKYPATSKVLRSLAIFTYDFSKDGSRFMITREFSRNIFKTRPKIFDINVFDQNLSLQWSKSETLSLNDKEFKTKSYQVNSDGDVEIMGEAKFDKDTVETKLLKNYSILDFTEKGEKSSVRNLGLEIADVKIIGEDFLHTSDKMIAAGFYKMPNVRRQYGYFLQEYSLDKLEREKNYYKTLAQETYTSDETETDPELKKLDTKSADDRFAFEVKNLRLDKSGNIFLIGEQHNYVMYTNRYGTTITDYYLDIYVLKLDPNGKLIWEIRIPKRQVYSSTWSRKSYLLKDFVSYASCLKDDNLLFFINDNPKNLNIVNSRPKSVRWKESQGQVVIVNKDGKMQRKLISDIPGNMFYTDFMYSLSNNRILIRYAPYKKYNESIYKIIPLDQILSQ